MDLVDIGQEYLLIVDLPGASAERLRVEPGPAHGTLLLKAEGVLAARPEGRVLMQERGSSGEGRFERIVPVAWDADVAKATATIANGVLTLVVPKRQSDEGAGTA